MDGVAALEPEESALRVHALDIGRLRNVPQAFVTLGHGWGEKVEAAIIMFVIVGGEHPIVVDTGTPDPETTRRVHGFELVRGPEQDPRAALERIGVAPEDVGTVVHTHLHWDHCSNNHLFANARVLVQKSELEYAVDPLEPHRLAYDVIRGMTPGWLASLDRIEAVDGEAEIARGVSVIPLPGHSPGSQGVLVQTGGGRYLIAGDCTDFYANWQGDERWRHIPTSTYTNLADYMLSFARMERLGAEIIPSHDPLVFERGGFW